MKGRRGTVFCTSSGRRMLPISALTGTTQCGSYGTVHGAAGRGFQHTRASRYLYLKVIGLAGNKLGDVIPGSIANLSMSMEYLSISSNMLPYCEAKMFTEATGALFHSGAEKKRKGVWIEVDNYEDRSERSNAVASEGSTVTAAASAGSTATSGTGLHGRAAAEVGVVRRRRGGWKQSCSGFRDRKLGRPRRTTSAPPSATTPGRARRYGGC